MDRGGVGGEEQNGGNLLSHNVTHIAMKGLGICIREESCQWKHVMIGHGFVGPVLRAMARVRLVGRCRSMQLKAR